MVAAVFDVEGKITAFNRTSRTLTANGLTFTVPSVLLVETRDLDLTGNITFDTLTDPTLEAQRSIIGGTVIATGTVSFTAVGTGFCTSFSVPAVALRARLCNRPAVQERGRSVLRSLHAHRSGDAAVRLICGNRR